jgi:hypothetical protein
MRAWVEALLFPSAVSSAVCRPFSKVKVMVTPPPLLLLLLAVVAAEEEAREEREVEELKGEGAGEGAEE